MARSFDLVDNKLAEASFFYEKLADPDCGLAEANWYLSAFASAGRSVTYGLQAVMSSVDGFTSWYAARQRSFQADPYCRFMLKLRNELVHIGSTPVNHLELKRAMRFLNAIISGKREGPRLFFGSFDDSELAPPSDDVVEVSERYLRALVQLAYECYIDFGPNIDPKQRYTAEHFASLGRTVENAEEEVFGIRGWTEAPDVPIQCRWEMIRDRQPGCGMNHLFERYLGKTVPEPERLASPFPTGNKAWAIPQALRKTGDTEADLRIYLDSLRKNRAS